MKIEYGLFITFLVFGLLLVPGSVFAAADSSQVSESSISSLALEHSYVEVQAKSSGSKSSSSSSKKIKDGDDEDDAGDSAGTAWWIWLLIGGVILVIIIIAVWYFFLRK